MKTKINNIFSSLRLRQILNDLKRRPEDASRDLGIKEKVLIKFLSGKKQINEQFVKKAVKIWPVNISDFINPHFNKSHSFKLMRFKDSIKTKRIMKRDGVEYYEYRDTVMDRDAPFRPEWIRELVYVKSNDPNNKSLKWNRGHLLHQLTYFVGEVNFYYLDSTGRKKVAIMNTGDSMYIAPYVPHTFASRTKNCEGYIIAITFSDKITNKIQNEISNFNKKKINEIIFSQKLETLNKVTIKKFTKKGKNNKGVNIVQLAKNKIIPKANFIQINVKKPNKNTFFNEYHHYIYTLSKVAKIKIENKILNLNNGDTLYLKPFTKFLVPKVNSSFLVAQVQSSFNKEVIEQLFYVGKNNFKRLIKDNSQWFK